MPAQLAIVLVSWNTKRLTLQAVESVRRDIQTHGPENSEIWVADNASTDGSADAIAQNFPDVHLLRLPENIGFGPANNRALQAMGFGKPDADPAHLPQAVYFLNSDTITHERATLRLFRHLMNQPQVGVVGARLSYENGGFQHSAFAFPGLLQLWIDLLPFPSRLYDSRLNGRYPRHLYKEQQPFAVGHTLGATMMVKAEVILQTGMFDEGFFMYAEEVDWSWRIHKAGWYIHCVPTAHVTHLEGQSTQQVKPKSILNLWQSRRRLFQKHYPWAKRQLAWLIIRLGMWRKIRQTHRAVMARQISSKEHDELVAVYRKIMQL